MIEYSKHVPVLVNEAIEGLKLLDHGVYIDATLGMGGYSKKILNSSKCKLVSIDRDPFAIKNALNLKKEFGVRVTIVKDLFSNLDQILDKYNISTINGITFDFGVSSPQIENPQRGFSFKIDGLLDMRMGNNDFSASDLINDNDQNTIENILRNYGEEKKARQISRAIIASKPIKTTKQLASIIYSILGKPRKDRIDPATRTFQALRIAVNNELEEIENSLKASLNYLAPKGRIVAVSFHSLEDRIVKKFFKDNSELKGNTNRHLPPSLNNYPKLKIISKKPITASDEELNLNPRSRSAKLRIAEKIEYNKDTNIEAA